MKRLFIVFAIVVAACNDSKVDSGNTEVVSSKPVMIDSITSGCYAMVIEKDSAFMKLEVSEDSVSGYLMYKPFEKDSNEGTFRGIKTNGKIKAWYTFRSEGMISSRQVIFRIDGSRLSEGYGDIDVTSDTAFFKYPQSLNYEENHPFTPVACSNSL